MMVTRWGFSKELGAVSYGENQDEVFLGMSVARQQNISEATAQKVDAEIHRIIDETYREALRRAARDPEILEAAKLRDMQVLEQRRRTFRDRMRWYRARKLL